jgi:hypothetical protein
MSEAKNEKTVVKSCGVKLLPQTLWQKAASDAIRINPVNAPAVHMLKMAMPEYQPSPARLALLTGKYWGRQGVNLTVGFMDNPPAELQAKILAHMNAWGKHANVIFRASNANPQVRISRTPNSGYWSYLGTDILQIPADQPTLNLDSFTMRTPDREFTRVVRHEAGHTLGFTHEHMRGEIIARIDREKAIEHFMRTQGWTREDVIAQVLTPVDDAVIGTAHADTDSVMCYWLPADIMKDKIAIEGGDDINETDADFAALVYPKMHNNIVLASTIGLAEEAQIAASVKQAIAKRKVVGVESITDNANLKTGLNLTNEDILSVAAQVTQFAARYKSGIIISPEEFGNHSTIHDCIHMIVEKIR